MTARSMEKLLIRPVKMEDAARVVEVFNASAIADGRNPDSTVEDMQREWQFPGFNLETDSWAALTPEGRLVGYMEFYEGISTSNYFSWGAVHPDYRRQGIGAHLRRLADARALESLPKAPPEARVSIATSVLSTNRGARIMLEREGFEHIRSFWRMRIDMDTPPAAPQFPEGITVRTHVVGQDDRAVWQALEDAFSDHWGHMPVSYEFFEHDMLKDKDFDPALWFLAMDGDEIAGFSLCFPKTNEDPEMGWVGDLGVRRPWRKRGLGLALLLHSFNEFYRRGTRKVGLGVDTRSLTGATRLYEKAGMRPDREWARYEKELRPGIEMSTRQLEEQE